MIRSARLSPSRMLLGAAVLTVGLAAPASAQSFIATTTDDVTLGLQLKRPFLAGDEGLRPWSSTLETDLLFRWGPNAFVQVGIPLAFAGADFADGTSLYVGGIGANFIFGPPGAPSSFLGFTLPTATNLAGPELALLVGLLGSEDEPELWAEDVMSVRGGIIPSWQVSEVARVGVRLGAALVAPNDVENLWLYGRGAAWGSAMVGAAEVRGDLVTSYFINSDDEFEEQLRLYLDGRLGLPGAPGRPGIFLRLPLDGEARDAIDFSAGVTARFGL